jgi:hypothetical protein
VTNPRDRLEPKIHQTPTTLDELIEQTHQLYRTITEQAENARRKPFKRRVRATPKPSLL